MFSFSFTSAPRKRKGKKALFRKSGPPPISPFLALAGRSLFPPGSKLREALNLGGFPPPPTPPFLPPHLELFSRPFPGKEGRRRPCLNVLRRDTLLWQIKKSKVGKRRGGGETCHFSSPPFSWLSETPFLLRSDFRSER